MVRWLSVVHTQKAFNMNVIYPYTVSPKYEGKSGYSLVRTVVDMERCAGYYMEIETVCDTWID